MFLSRHERVALAALGTLLLLVLGATWWVERRPTPPVAVASHPAATNTVAHAPTDPPPAQKITVHVAGAVVHPGLVTVEQGARVWDAIQAAGGATADGRPDVLNLAEHVSDGERIQVPTRQEVLAAGSAWQPTGTGGAQGNGLVDVNHASLDQLESLPGVGPALAQRIVNYRKAHGPFQRIEDLLNVIGIGPHVLDGMKDKIVIR